MNTGEITFNSAVSNVDFVICCKNAHIVSVGFRCLSVSSSIPHGTAIATLPYGFRPQNYAKIMVYGNVNNMPSCPIVITNTGDIFQEYTSDVCTRIQFFATFVI